MSDAVGHLYSGHEMVGSGPIWKGCYPMSKYIHKYNICGISELEWIDGICSHCGSVCAMTGDVVVEKRVYDYAVKHGFLDCCVLNFSAARAKLERMSRKKKVPKYFRDAISCDGLTFSSLHEFPCNQMLRVCRDSNDGTFQVGDLVWRSTPKKGFPDGINFVKEAGCLDGEYCSDALKGAMFEISYADIPR